MTKLYCWRIISKDTGKAITKGQEVNGLGHIYYNRGTAQNSLEDFIRGKNFRLRFINNKSDYAIKKFELVEVDD